MGTPVYIFSKKLKKLFQSDDVDRAKRWYLQSMDWIQIFVGLKGATKSDTQKLLRFFTRCWVVKNASDRLSVPLTRVFEDDRWREFYLSRGLLSKGQSKALESIFSKKADFHMNWREVKRLFRDSGFEAVRTHGAIDLRVYLFLVANRIHPVAWKLTDRHVDFSVDLFHEIGHAIALLDPEYRAQLQKFANIFLQDPNRIPSRDLIRNYRNLFEMSIIRDAKGNYHPIGAAMVTFEPFFFNSGKIKSRKEYARHIVWYSSKKVWKERCKKAMAEWEEPKA